MGELVIRRGGLPPNETSRDGTSLGSVRGARKARKEQATTVRGKLLSAVARTLAVDHKQCSGTYSTTVHLSNTCR